jgi:hypothetical protein
VHTDLFDSHPVLSVLLPELHHSPNPQSISPIHDMELRD